MCRSGRPKDFAGIDQVVFAVLQAFFMNNSQALETLRIELETSSKVHPSQILPSSSKITELIVAVDPCGCELSSCGLFFSPSLSGAINYAYFDGKSSVANQNRL